MQFENEAEKVENHLLYWGLSYKVKHTACLGIYLVKTRVSDFVIQDFLSHVCPIWPSNKVSKKDLARIEKLFLF